MVVLQQGKVIAQGKMTEVVGQVNIAQLQGELAGAVIEVKVIEKNSQWQLLRVGFDGGELWLNDTGETLGQALRLRILARDVSLTLSEHRDTSILNRLPARIERLVAEEKTAKVLVSLRVGQSVINASVTRRSAETLNLSPGSRVWAQIKSVAIVR